MGYFNLKFFGPTLALIVTVGSALFWTAPAHAGLQCPGVSTTMILQGGDRTDPRRLSSRTIKLLTGRWTASEDGFRIIDINLVKEKGSASKVSLTLHEFDAVTQKWNVLITDNVDYINGQAIFHVPENSVNERVDIIIGAFTDKADSSTTLVASVARCDSRGEEILKGNFSARPVVLKPYDVRTK